MKQTIEDLSRVNDDIFVVCYGTSLLNFAWDRLRNRTTIAVNDAIKKVPNCNYHLFSDKELWNSRYCYYDYNSMNPETLLVCRPPKDREIRENYSNIDPFKVYSFHRTNWGARDSVTPTNARLFMSRTVVCPGVQLAWKLGAKNIYVLGFDCYDLGTGKQRITYADGETQQEKKKNKTEEGQLTIRNKHEAWIKQARQMTEKIIHKHDPDVKIYNLNPQSRADCWEKLNPDEILKEDA